MTDIITFPRARRIPVQDASAPAVIPLHQRLHESDSRIRQGQAILAGVEAEIVRERNGVPLPPEFRDGMIAIRLALTNVGALMTPGDAVRMRQRIIEWYEEGRRQSGPDGAA